MTDQLAPPSYASVWSSVRIARQTAHVTHALCCAEAVVSLRA